MLISIGLSLQYFVLRYILVNATKVLQLTCELDQGLIKEYECHCEKFIQNVFIPFNRAIVYYREMKFNQYLDMDVFKQVDVEKNENSLGGELINKELQEVKEKEGRKKKSKVIRTDIVNKRKAQVVKDM